MGGAYIVRGSPVDDPDSVSKKYCLQTICSVYISDGPVLLFDALFVETLDRTVLSLPPRVSRHGQQRAGLVFPTLIQGGGRRRVVPPCLRCRSDFTPETRIFLPLETAGLSCWGSICYWCPHNGFGTLCFGSGKKDDAFRFLMSGFGRLFLLLFVQRVETRAFDSSKC